MPTASKPAPAPAPLPNAPAQQRRCEAFENSFIREIGELLKGAAVAPYDRNSKETRAACEAHNAAVAEIGKDLDAGQRDVGAALAEADESDDYTTLVMAIENARFDRPGVAQKVVKAWADALQLADRKLAELQPLAVKAESTAEELVNDVKRQLTEVGSGVESLPAYRDNPAAAARQFDFQVRTGNIKVRAALADAGTARNQLQSIKHARRASVRGLEQAKRYLHKLVVKMAST